MATAAPPRSIACFSFRLRGRAGAGQLQVDVLEAHSHRSQLQQAPSTADHGRGQFATNVAVVDAGTRLAGIVGAGEIEVHSYHHQGVERIGEGLVPTAHTDDDLVYAFEAPGDLYLVAVQWHPEQNSEDRRLFAALVAAASAYAESRGADARGAHPGEPRNAHSRREVDA